MPSTSKKQHNFMAAIANNPSFAKKVGVPQSVGKDFSAADKGRKFGRGGMAAINNQDTQHGSMDMPFKSLKKFGGMKSGGKVKRYFAGDEVENTAPDVAAENPTEKPAESLDKMTFGKAFREKLNELGEGRTFMWRGKSYSTDLVKPSNPISKSTPTAKATPSNETNAGAVISRTSPFSKKMVGEDAMGNRRTQAQEDAYVASLSKKPESKMPPSLNYAPMRRGMKFGGSVKESKAMMARFEKSGKDVEKKGMKEGSKADMAMDKKQMMGMKKGGMAKYAKGGGIESRGKTKGTVIRMASGGSVSARADGIAQRGKTKFKMC